MLLVAEHWVEVGEAGSAWRLTTALRECVGEMRGWKSSWRGVCQPPIVKFLLGPERSPVRFFSAALLRDKAWEPVLKSIVGMRGHSAHFRVSRS